MSKAQITLYFHMKEEFILFNKVYKNLFNSLYIRDRTLYCIYKNLHIIHVLQKIITISLERITSYKF